MNTIDLRALPRELREVVTDLAADVRAAGGRAWMVGGCVRDLLTGGPGSVPAAARPSAALETASLVLGGYDTEVGPPRVKDVDLEVFGLEPDELERVVGARYAYDPCGVSFGVLKLKHLDIDVSLPRRESKRGLGHKGFLIESDPTLTVREAASRRDFTVNAIYCDPLTGELEDPWHGLDDLKARVLRHVSPKFVEDPLRVLRGMQFVARFDLDPAPETVALCRTVGTEGLPPERLFEEWAKFLTKGVRLGKGLEFLRATGWVNHFPELACLIGCRQDPKWHPEGDVWEHTKCCLDAFARRRIGDKDEDLIVGLAVLCHDFGKPATTATDPVTGHIRSLGHDEAGVEPTLSFLRRLTNEERILRDVPPLVRCHMRPFAMWRSKVGDAAVRRLAREVVRIDRLVRVARADDEGRPPELAGGSSGGEDLAWLVAAAERLRVADAAPKPILQGRDLIALGHKPSPQFGVWLKASFEAQLEGAFTDLEGAIRHFQENIAPGEPTSVSAGIPDAAGTEPGPPNCVIE